MRTVALFVAIMAAAQPELNSAMDFRSCGDESNCVESTQLNAKVAWRVRSDDSNLVDFVMSTIAKDIGSSYLALGFNARKEGNMMIGASVVECLYNGQTVQIFSSHAAATARPVRYEDVYFGLSDRSGSYRNKNFTCHFTRKVRDSSQASFMDLTQPTCLIMAKGPLEPNTKDTLQYHGGYRDSGLGSNLRVQSLPGEAGSVGLESQGIGGGGGSQGGENSGEIPPNSIFIKLAFAVLSLLSTHFL